MTEAVTPAAATASARAPERNAWRWWVIACLVLPPAVFLLWLLGFVNRGFDVTDEGYYLNSIAHPHLYSISTTQFGAFYHYLYYPFTDRVAALRTTNLLLTVVLGTLFGVAIFSRDKERPVDWPMVVAASFTLSFATLLIVANWFVTPSYNSLNLQGLLIAATALLIIGKDRSPPSIYAVVLLALGGWITFLAKPSSAALLSCSAIVHLLLTGHARIRTLAVGSISAILLLVLTALVLDGSLIGFYRRLADSAAFPAALTERYSVGNLFRFSWPSMPSGQWRLLIGVAAFLALMIVICSRAGLARRIALALCAMVGFLPLLVLEMPSALAASWQWTFALQILSVPAGIGAALVLLWIFDRTSLPSGSISDAAMLWTLPYIFAFGSNNDYWILAPWAGIFWIGSILVVFLRTQRETTAPFKIVPIASASFAISAIVLLIGMALPYRQTQSVRLNDGKTVMQGGRTELLLSRDFAAYFAELQRTAAAAGFRHGDPMIDLTGHYPGALYALGAQALGQAWLVGGYPGSERVARALFARVPCASIARAWLLTEPGGPRALTEASIGNFGQQYEVVARIKSLVGEVAEPQIQNLLKPVHDIMAIETTCQNANRIAAP